MIKFLYGVGSFVMANAPWLDNWLCVALCGALTERME